MHVSLLLIVAWPILAADTTPPTPFEIVKARALLRQQLACLACHELDGDGGRVGPALTDVGRRRTAEYIRAMVEEPQRVVPGSAMPKTELPRTTLDLVIRYLTRGARDASGGPPAPSASTLAPGISTVPNGATLYAKWCAACHGERGAGDGPNAPYLPVRPAVHSSASAMSVRSDDALFDVIAAGGAMAGKSPRMPAFGATLGPPEIRALVGHIRALCNCEGPAWSRDGSNR